MTPIFSYHPTRSCGRSSTFRRTCTNSFTIGSCGASECVANPPSTVCLKPVLTDGNCELCTARVAVLISDYTGLYQSADDWGWVSGQQHLLLPIVSLDPNQCAWVKWFYLDRGEESVITNENTCGQPVNAKLVTSGDIRATLGFIEGSWNIHEVIRNAWYATEDVPECGISVGDFLEFTLFGGQTTNQTFPPFSGCTNPFPFQWGPGDFIKTISFLELPES